MNHDFEQRFIEIRALESANDEMIIEGRPIVFNSPATHKSGKRSFTETIYPLALDKTNMKDVVLRYNHRDTVMIMARTRNKSLELIKDQQGLYIRAKLIDTQQNRDIFKGIKERLIDRMSFAFRVAPGGDKWSFGETEIRREIHDIEYLHDVAVVDTPFYDSTSVTARSFDLLESELRRLESQSEFEIEKLKTMIRSKTI